MQKSAKTYIAEQLKFSYTYKIFEKLWIFLSLKFKKSLFFYILSADFSTERIVKRSFIIKFLNFYFSKLKFIFKKIFLKKFEESFLLRFLKVQIDKIFYNFLTINTKFLGVVLFSFSANYFFLQYFFYHKNSLFFLYISLSVIVFSIVLIVVNKNLLKYIKNSIFFEFLYNFFCSILETSLYKETDNSLFSFELSPILIGSVGGILASYYSFLNGVIFVFAIVSLVLIFCSMRFMMMLLLFFPAIIKTKFVLMITLAGLISFFLKYLREEKDFKIDIVEVFILIFIFLMFVSSVTSFYKFSSMKTYIVYASFLLSSIVLRRILTSEKLLIDSLKIVNFSALIVSLCAVMQLIFNAKGSEAWTDKKMFKSITIRVYSTLKNPNILGSFLAITFFVSLCLFLIENKKKMKFFYAFTGFMIFVSLIFTFSRSSWIGFLISICIFLAIFDKRFLLIFPFIFIACLAFMPSFVIKRFSSIGNTRDTSTLYRVYIWFGTLKMLKVFWLFGIGPRDKNFKLIYSNYSYDEIFALHSHNLFLQTLVENGIVGVMVFLLILFFIFKKFVVFSIEFGKKTKHFIINLSIMSSILGFFVASLFDYPFYEYRVFLVFWQLVSIGLSNYDIEKNKMLEEAGEV